MSHCFRFCLELIGQLKWINQLTLEFEIFYRSILNCKNLMLVFSILTEEEEYFHRLFVKQELLQNIFVHEAYHQNWRDTANKTK